MAGTAQNVAPDTQASVNRRRWSNFFSKPQYQVRYTNFMIGGGLVSICTTAVLIERKLADVDALLNSSEAIGIGGQAQIYDALADVAQVTFVGFAAFVIYACVIALVMSHRISGPTVAIMTFIDELKKGNYAEFRRLRRSDELQPIHENLQQLAQHLRNKD